MSIFSTKEKEKKLQEKNKIRKLQTLMNEPNPVLVLNTEWKNVFYDMIEKNIIFRNDFLIVDINKYIDIDHRIIFPDYYSYLFNVLFMDRSSDGQMWVNRAKSMLHSTYGVYLDRLIMKNESSNDATRNSISLFEMIKCDCIPYKYQKNLSAYLKSLPGYHEEKGIKQSQITIDQHGYLEMQFTKVLGTVDIALGNKIFQDISEIKNKKIVIVCDNNMESDVILFCSYFLKYLNIYSENKYKKSLNNIVLCEKESYLLSKYNHILHGKYLFISNEFETFKEFNCEMTFYIGVPTENNNDICDYVKNKITNFKGDINALHNIFSKKIDDKEKEDVYFL